MVLSPTLFTTVYWFPSTVISIPGFVATRNFRCSVGTPVVFYIWEMKLLSCHYLLLFIVNFLEYLNDKSVNLPIEMRYSSEFSCETNSYFPAIGAMPNYMMR